MQKTANYGLNKPDGTDTVDISVLNGNMDTIDVKLKNNSDDTEALGEKVSSHLADMTKHTTGYINIKDYGAVGDDSTDDTAAITNALNYAYTNSLSVIMPKGTYKITSPIVIDHTLTKTPSLHIIGIGNTFTTKDGLSASLFKGYNIPAKRGIIEFTGRGVNQSTGVTLENLGFLHDYDTCDSLSFNMVIGDANMPTVRKCQFSGFNNVLIRCGTASNYTGYIFSCARFEQCFFTTNRYVDWDGTTILSKAQYGFCIAPEHIFATGLPNIWDSVTFSECNFLGSVYQYGNVLYENCMWEIPGSYKPEINIIGSSVFNTAFLPDNLIDCEIGIVVLGGKANLINPYFEDVRMCIATFKTGNSQDKNIFVDNPVANATLNNIATVGGDLQYSKYFIKTYGTNYTVPIIEVKNGAYAIGNYSQGYSDGFIINTVALKLIIENVNNVTENLINDTFSRVKHFEGIYTDSNNGYTLNFTATGTIPVAEYAYGRLLEIDNWNTFREMSSHAIVKEISLIVPSTITTGAKMAYVSFTGDVAALYSNLTDYVAQSLSIENTYCINETYGSYTKYTFKNLPSFTDEQSLRKWYIKKGSKLALFVLLPSTISANTDVTVNVKLLI